MFYSLKLINRNLRKQIKRRENYLKEKIKKQTRSLVSWFLKLSSDKIVFLHK